MSSETGVVYCRSSSAISAPNLSAMRSTCLASMRRPARSQTSPLLVSKLTSAATLPSMRSTPGETELSSMPSARSRGQKPFLHTAQW